MPKKKAFVFGYVGGGKSKEIWATSTEEALKLFKIHMRKTRVKKWK